MGSPAESDESEKANFTTVGREIMGAINGPRKTIMGDIYHSIKATVDKMTKSYIHKKEQKKLLTEKDTRANDSKVLWK